ncbi:MAG: ferrous iron transport protein B [Kineosporiaceae bacterium]
MSGERTPPEALTCAAGAGTPRGAHPVVAFAGAPNVGKSTLFNACTGARRDTGNWPGTSVEVGHGSWALPGMTVDVVDLPGAYSLTPLSPDEALTRALLRDAPPEERPCCVVVVLDATALARGLYLLAELRELPLRLVVALTMSDVAHRRNLAVDADRLSAAVGVPVVAVDPRRRDSATALGTVVARATGSAVPTQRPRALSPPPAAPPSLPDPAGKGAAPGTGPVPRDAPGHAARDDDHPENTAGAPRRDPAGDPLGDTAGDAADPLLAADERFTWIDRVVASSVRHRTGLPDRPTRSDRIDQVATSPVFGPVLFLALMWAVFQITTTVARPLQEALSWLLTGPVTDGVRQALERADLADGWVGRFLVEGLLSGVGMLLTFVPMMALMFGLLAVLEDSGYMARAAVVTDRVMRALGLPGRAFLPLIVGFGCNVPAVAATRVLGDARHRLLTALLVPFTSCSARLAVYLLVASIFFPDNTASTVFIMYLLSLVFVVAAGRLLRSTLLRAFPPDPLVLDLPPYHLPVPRLVGQVAWVRVRGFLATASGIIVAAVAVVWVLQAVPAGPGPAGADRPAVENSVFASVSRTLTPVFAPAGFGDWHATGALITGFVAKEGVISVWSQTYAAQQEDGSGQARTVGPDELAPAVRADFTAASNGHPAAAAWAFLVFLLAYTPCVATLAAQRREIGWRWTAFGVGMQLVLAWSVAVAVFQIGSRL